MKPLHDELARLLLIELHRRGYEDATYDIDTGLITPTLKHPTIKFNQDGYTYRKEAGPETEKLARGELGKLHREVTAAWNAWKDGRPMLEKVDEGYRVLASTGDTILAARDLDDEGLEFVVWDILPEKTGVVRGDRTFSFTEAKQEFTLRAGLVSRKELLTELEQRVAYQALSYFKMDAVDEAECELADRLRQKLVGLNPELNQVRFGSARWGEPVPDTDHQPWLLTMDCADLTQGIPFAARAIQNYHWEENPVQLCCDAAKIAEDSGIKMIYGMDGVPDGQYLDTPANRQVIQQVLDEFPQYSGLTNEFEPEQLEEGMEQCQT